MPENVNVLMWIAGQLIAAAAIWGTLRADIKHMHESIRDNKEHTNKVERETKASFEGVHSRIDRLFERHMNS